jgi:CheY-like chemotaxis protein
VFFELARRRQEVARQRDELEAATKEAQKYSEALKEADRRKDEFLATLAHELRNPLAPIRSGLELLKAEPVGGKADAIREMIERQLAQMVMLIDDLLDTSRISQGKIGLRRESMDIREALESAVDSVQPLIAKKRHNLIQNIADAPMWVDGDAMRLAQIVGNMLNNAAKYTPEGGSITLEGFADDGDIVVQVTDNGIGIPTDMLTNVFDLFTQVDNHTDQAQGGLGIGLALAKQLAGLHGGTITVHSAGKDQGSTFMVRLPRIEAPDQVTESKPAASRDEGSKALNILVVDDNVDSAQTMGWMLEMEGHQYTLAHTGKQAIEAAHNINPDVILLDIGLPDMTGYDVCRQLRASGDFQKTLFVAQTGWGQQKDKDLASEAGFDRHFVKPLKPMDIEQIIESASI